MKPPQAAPERFDYSLNVDISAGANRADIEAQYGGTVVVWHPEAGFAVLGLNDTGGLSTLDANDNQNTFATPEARASSVDNSGGFAWSGGRSAWSGGRSAWSGGRSAWSGGEPTTFVENLDFWDQVDLPQGQALAPNLGAGIKVAVIDTGIDLQHPAFQGRLAPENEWKDFVDGDSYPQEVWGTNYGHGTGVADVIVQVAPNVTILPLRVLGPDGSGDTTNVIAAIDYAVQKGAQVINLSLGTTTADKTLENLIKYAFEQNVLIVASAGNSGLENIQYPARYKDVVGVGSVTRYDELSTFSAYGKELGLLAPGEFLFTAAPDQGVAYWSGTSFAAPIVSGALALALAERGRYGWRSAQAFTEAFKYGSDDIRYTGRNYYYPADELGKGRLDINDFFWALFCCHR